jgi:hypothetical protein
MTKNLDLQIDRARAAEADTVWNIINTCSKWLETSGMSHWTNYYTRQLVDKKLATQEIYIAKIDAQPADTIYHRHYTHLTLSL